MITTKGSSNYPSFHIDSIKTKTEKRKKRSPVMKILTDSPNNFPIHTPGSSVHSKRPGVSIPAAAAAAKSPQSCPTPCDPTDAARQAQPSLGFSRQEHRSGLPFPSPMHENER